MKYPYQQPGTHQYSVATDMALMVTSWEVQDGDGNKEDDFGVVEGDPEGGLSSKAAVVSLGLTCKRPKVLST